jgi:hypothetical protein
MSVRKIFTTVCRLIPVQHDLAVKLVGELLHLPRNYASAVWSTDKQEEGFALRVSADSQL